MSVVLSTQGWCADTEPTMTEHAVAIAGGGPTGLTLAGELALAGVDVAIVERRASQDLIGSRAGGLHSRAIEVLDQRGIADRFLARGRVYHVVHFRLTELDIRDFPTRHNYVLGLWQNQIERLLADWVAELAIPIYRGREVTAFAQDDSGVDVELSDGQRSRCPRSRNGASATTPSGSMPSAGWRMGGGCGSC
jgi:3-(3-hydroxy-phenyl)propionate hydroxylase